MNFLGKLFGRSTEPSTVVEAMLGICVHAPDILIEPPSNVRNSATKALTGALDNHSLSPSAAVAFLTAHGGLSFSESEAQARRDLPQQLQELMRKNGLNPENYEWESFSEDLRPDLKILWAAASPTPPTGGQS